MSDLRDQDMRAAHSFGVGRFALGSHSPGQVSLLRTLCPVATLCNHIWQPLHRRIWTLSPNAGEPQEVSIVIGEPAEADH